MTFFGIQLWAISQRVSKLLFCIMSLKIVLLKLLPRLPRGQELKYYRHWIQYFTTVLMLGSADIERLLLAQLFHSPFGNDTCHETWHHDMETLPAFVALCGGSPSKQWIPLKGSQRASNAELWRVILLLMLVGIGCWANSRIFYDLRCLITHVKSLWRLFCTALSPID